MSHRPGAREALPRLEAVLEGDIPMRTAGAALGRGGGGEGLCEPTKLPNDKYVCGGFAPCDTPFPLPAYPFPWNPCGGGGVQGLLARK